MAFVVGADGCPGGWIAVARGRDALPSDDFLEAARLMLVAGRIASGEAVCFPDPPGHDALGIPVAI